MNGFEILEKSLIWRGEGETLILTPWGKDSLRVRSRLIQEILDDRFALLDPEESDAGK